MKKFFSLFLNLLLISISVLFGQSDPKSKYVIYTFTVKGVKTSTDVTKLDDFLKSRKGVLTSVTDLEKKSVEVKCETYITYAGIIAAVKSQGFEAAEQHQTRSSDQ